MPLIVDDHSATLDAVKALTALIHDAADDGETQRALRSDVVDGLKRAGTFRMMVPRCFGGDELGLTQACRVIEELSAADAAAGWTAMVAVGFNVLLSNFPIATVDKIYSDGPDVALRGAVAPIGRYDRTDRGYRLSGRWPFASGPYQPKWVVAGGTVYENGQPVMGPLGAQTRVGLVPAEEVRFIDTWYTVGLCATDSRDFEVADAFVPEAWATDLFSLNAQCYGDPLFNLPFPLLAGPTHSAVCLGIVRASMAELSVLARTKRSAFNPAKPLGASEAFQHRLAELAVRHDALRSLLAQQLREVAALGRAEEALSIEDMTRHASYTGYIHAQAMDVVNEAFSLAGSTPCYKRSTLQRRWRDIRVAAQHHAGSTSHYASYGACLAGQQPVLPGR